MLFVRRYCISLVVIGLIVEYVHAELQRLARQVCASLEVVVCIIVALIIFLVSAAVKCISLFLLRL